MNVFDKNAFAKLLFKAKGDMTINEYARKSGVSASHISRFLRGMLDTPPSPQTIKKLVEYSWNGIEYDDMMKVCGHLDELDSSKNKISIIDILNKRVAYDEIEQLFDMAIYFIEEVNLSNEDLTKLQNKTFELAYTITTKSKKQNTRGD